MAHKWSFLLLVLFLTSDLVLASKTQFILAGDIGGTNARLRITKVTSKQRIVLKEHVYLVKDYPDFNQLITQFVREQIGDQGLSAICLAVAGPIVNQKVQFTNSSWQIAAQTLADLFSTSFGKSAVN